MKIISFFSFKSGVGTTTLVSNLGTYWASNGKRVLLKKALANSRVPQGMELSNQPVDYLLIDCGTDFPEPVNPSLGYLAHKIVIVSSLNNQSLQGLKYTLEALKARQIPLGHFPVLLTLVFSPIPETEDKSVFQQIQKAHEIVIQSMRYDKANNRELSPASFSLHYNQTMAIGESLLVLEYPQSIYAKEIISIANHLEGKVFEQDFQDEFIKKARRKAIKVVSYPVHKAHHEKAETFPQSTIPFAQLPPWYWPVQQLYEDKNAGLNYIDKLIPRSHTDINRESLLNSLSHNVSLDKTEKEQVLNSFKSLDPKKIDDLLESFEKERISFLNLWIDAHTHKEKYSIIKMYFEKQSQWAEIILEDEKKGTERFFNALMQDHVFPLWERSPYYWDILANKLADQGRYQEAETGYQKAIQIDKKYAYPWNGLGNLLKNNLNRYKEAEQAYRKAIQLDEKFAYPCNGLGNLLKDHFSLYKEAEQTYWKAIQLNEEDPYPWNGLGNLLQDHLNQYEDAKQVYLKAIRLDQKFAYPWNGLGALLTDHFNRYEEAEQAYQKAIQLDPKYADPWNNLGNLLKDHLNRYEEAEQAYLKAIELDPKDSDPFNGLGLLERNAYMDYAGAIKTFEKGLLIKDEEIAGYLNMNLGHTYMLTENKERAVLYLKKSLDIFDNQPDYHTNTLLIAVEINNQDIIQKSITKAKDKAEQKNLWAAKTLLFYALAYKEESIHDFEELTFKLMNSYNNHFNLLVYLDLLARFCPHTQRNASNIAKKLLSFPKTLTDKFKDKPKLDKLYDRFRIFVQRV